MNRPRAAKGPVSGFVRSRKENGAGEEYNLKGKITRQTDPLGRANTYTYAANGIDLLEVRRVNGQTTELLESRTYNTQHRPLTVTDAAGQTTTYTYNSQGQLLTVVTPPRDELSQAQRTTTLELTRFRGHCSHLGARRPRCRREARGAARRDRPTRLSSGGA
jgi:YD repeat-containing protein